MRLTLLSALLPCLACVRPHDDAGAPDLTKGDPEVCTDKVAHAKEYSLCFVSGGLNPKKRDDKDHYDDPAWEAVKTGGVFHAELSKIGCGYCPAIGYWPPFAEKSIMIYCPKSAELKKTLFVHCVKSGIALFQDAVLYRGDGTNDIHVISTYKDSGELKPEDIDEDKVDPDLLKIGVFGKADKATEGMGSHFLDEEAPADGDLTAMVNTDNLFAFKADFNSRAFCHNCKVVELGKFLEQTQICVLSGTGVDNNGISGGRMCNQLCATCKDDMRFCCPKVDLAAEKSKTNSKKK